MDGQRADRWSTNCCAYVTGELQDSTDLLALDDFLPFDEVRLYRVLTPGGEPTEWVTIEGLRDGGAREVTVRYREVLAGADRHLREDHGKSMDDPMSIREFAHATVRGAIAFLMD